MVPVALVAVGWQGGVGRSYLAAATAATTVTATAAGPTQLRVESGAVTLFVAPQRRPSPAQLSPSRSSRLVGSYNLYTHPSGHASPSPPPPPPPPRDHSLKTVDP